MLLGLHESVAGGLEKAFEHAAARGTEALQIFTKSASMWKEPALDAGAVASFRASHRAFGGRPVVAHGSYLVNLCSDRPDILERSREALFFELERCNELGVASIAFHPGFVTNGLFYIYYTQKNSRHDMDRLRHGMPLFFPYRSVVSEMKVSAGDPDRADTSSDLVLSDTS